MGLFFQRFYRGVGWTAPLFDVQLSKQFVVSSFSSLTTKEIIVSNAANPTPPEEQERVQVELDDSNATQAYANFCRVTGTPEELIIDFGLNPQPIGVPTEPIPVTQRIITNFYTAKRMLQALTLTVQRHEMTFGVLETDVQKRVRSDVMAASMPQTELPPGPPTEQ